MPSFVPHRLPRQLKVSLWLDTVLHIILTPLKYPYPASYNMSHEDPYCDHTIATGSTLAELSRESGFADFVSAYAQGRESSITTTASGAPLTFPSDATVGATFDSVDPALRQKFRANILDLLEDSRCQRSKKQLESVVDSELDAPLASRFGPDHDLQQLGMKSR